MTDKVYIGLGGNLDNPLPRLQQLSEELRVTKWLAGYQQSSFYCTRPIGPQDQPDFINSVACFHTQNSPHDVLARLQEMEMRFGRVRSGEQWGPRTVDLDILLYGSQIVDSEDLQIPHPHMAERAFVLVPLAEIAPDLVIPGQSDTVRDMLVALDQSGVSRV